MSTILTDARTTNQTPFEHPSWCDPRSCRISDLREDGVGLLLVHAVLVWAGAASGRVLELIQTQTLADDARTVLRTHRPHVSLNGLTPREVARLDPDAVERLAQAVADEAAQLARATAYASELATAGGSLAPVYVHPIDALLERLARPVAGGVR